jgi:hypothetical protein
MPRTNPAPLPARSVGSRAASHARNAPSPHPTARSTTTNRPPTASNVDAIFSPTRPELKLGERQYSPEFQHKLTETAARTKSFAQAATLAELWSGQSASSRNLSRVVEEAAAELVEQRDRTVDDFTHHRRGPEGEDPKHALAAVFVDGGRVQTREQSCGPGVHGAAWQEDKIARLQTMTTPCHSSDPCPEPLACFQQPILHSAKTRDAKSPDISGEIEAFLDAEPIPPPTDEPAPRWQPKPLVRTCVATMKPLEEFRWMVQAEAKQRHFFTARKRAFVADGSAGNWTLHARHFPDFVPILDFVHAAEYLHAAAKVVGSVTQGCHWVRDLWQGRSVDVIAALRAALDACGVGHETLEEKHASFPLQRAWTYLTNASDKVDYPRYRREGLPITSSLIESQIKEFNMRLKGSEKFWHESNAEGMLQVVCRVLDEEGPTLSDHFESRPTSPFRRSYTQTLAA